MSTMSTTPMATQVQASAIAESTDYQALMTEIKLTIDKNDLLFKQIQQSNYPNAGSYIGSKCSFC